MPEPGAITVLREFLYRMIEDAKDQVDLRAGAAYGHVVIKLEELTKPVEQTTKPTIDQMVVQLIDAGWTKDRGSMTRWISPGGQMVRGPALAWKTMKEWK